MCWGSRMPGRVQMQFPDNMKSLLLSMTSSLAHTGTAGTLLCHCSHTLVKYEVIFVNYEPSLCKYVHLIDKNYA